MIAHWNALLRLTRPFVRGHGNACRVSARRAAG
jgi:hypothetical protein